MLTARAKCRAIRVSALMGPINFPGASCRGSQVLWFLWAGTTQALYYPARPIIWCSQVRTASTGQRSLRLPDLRTEDHPQVSCYLSIRCFILRSQEASGQFGGPARNHTSSGIGPPDVWPSMGSVFLYRYGLSTILCR